MKKLVGLLLVPLANLGACLKENSVGNALLDNGVARINGMPETFTFKLTLFPNEFGDVLDL